MANPILALIVPLGDGGLGFWGGTAPPYPSQGLPGLSPGQPSQPIYHPGHPDHGRPSHPIYGQGGQPTHPIHIPGVPDQGLPPGQPVPPGEITHPEVPPEYEDDLVIAVKAPGATEWKMTAYTVAPDQGQPAPTPHR